MVWWEVEGGERGAFSQVSGLGIWEAAQSFTRARKPWVRISFGVPNVCFRTRALPNSLKNWICGCSPGSQYRQLGGVTPNLGWMR